jgi:predicted alpha/beta hydrolase
MRRATERDGAPARPRSRPGPAAAEDVEIRTRDGWALRADVREPAGKPIGVALLGHAMMARRTEFDRPAAGGLARLLVERGWRVVNLDLRGHGQSGPGAHQGASYTYDDFVRHDLPAACEFARGRGKRALPVVVVGHSLAAHVALAAAGAGLVDLDAIACIAANVWLPSLEPSRARWAVKRATLAGIVGVCRRLGRFPARTLRFGSDDEPRAYFEAFARWARTDAWTSDDGALDYTAGLARVRVPVAALVSDGDALACVPECGVRFLSACAGPREIVRVARGDDGGPPPGHMALVTSRRAASAWARIESWMRSAVAS